MALSGCATVQDKIKLTEQTGIERFYNYSYNKVFYACEDTLSRMNWEITKSDFDNGYIYSKIRWQSLFLSGNGSCSFVATGIRITKINDHQTAVKVLKFNSMNKKYFYADFFHTLENLLNRNQ